MKNIFLSLAFFLSFALNASSQTPVDSVKATVNQLFEAMKTANPVLLLDCFADSAILQTIGSRAGQIIIRNETKDAFANSIKQLKAGSADERIEFASVLVDGNLASVWTPYKFYFNGNFSHCGANSFQLVRIGGKWKIQYLIDTRRRDCN